MCKGPEAEGAWHERRYCASQAEETSQRRKQIPDKASLVVSELIQSLSSGQWEATKRHLQAVASKNWGVAGCWQGTLQSGAVRRAVLMQS